MRTEFPSDRLVILLLLTLLTAPSVAADHDPDAPAAFVGTHPLYRMEHDPWAGGTWVAGGGLFFHDDEGGFSYIGARDGLPVDKVHDLSTTPTHVWVNTGIGPAVMNKGDRSFQQVRTEDGNLFLHEGRAVFSEGDQVWVGTNTQGLFVVDSASLVATPVPNPINGSRFENQIMDVAADGNLLFISVAGYGLVEWDRSTGKTRHFDVAFLSEHPVYGRVLVTSTKVWIATAGDGTVVVDRATGESIEYTGPYTINAQSVYGLARLGAEYWFATDGGVSRYDAGTDSWQSWQEIPGHATDVVVVDGTVYSTTNQGLLIKYDRPSGTWVDAHWWGSHQVLPHNTVFGCTFDGEALVVSTGGGGALRYGSTSRAWERIGDPDDPTKRPLDILVWDTVATPDLMWFASHKGISVIDRASGAWGHARTDDRPVGHIVDNPVRDIFADESGVWAATTAHKILRGPEKGQMQPGNVAHWDPQENVLTRYDTDDGLAGDSALTLTVADGNVWVGFERGGVDVVDARTGQVRHAWSPADEKVQVLSIAARPDAVWVGTTAGLFRLDPVTFQPSKVTALPELVVSSLLWDEGRLWVGAVLGGVYRYDPSSGQAEAFTTPGIADASGLCMVRDGGLLYVGTQWGVDRLDIERGEWLSKDGSMMSPSAPAFIGIGSPQNGASFSPGDTVTLRGTAQVPQGAWVEVGVAGQWIRATGTTSWSARFPVDESFSGPLSLSARVHDGQRTLAQDAVALEVQGGGEGGDGTARPDFTHEQVLSAEVGSTIPFLVEFAPEGAAVTGWVDFHLPDSEESLTLPLENTAPGILSAVSPVLDAAGEARYVVRLEWEDGRSRLPELYSGPSSYLVTIQEAAGRPIGFLTLVRCDAGIAPGESGEVTFGVQNTGTRAGLMEVNFAGPASAWITEQVEPFDLPPSQTRFVRVPLSIPEDTPYGPHDLFIGAGPVQRTEGSVHLTTCGVLVKGAEGTQADPGDVPSSNTTGETSGKGIPHPGILVVLVALASAWLRRR